MMKSQVVAAMTKDGEKRAGQRVRRGGGCAPRGTAIRAKASTRRGSEAW